MVEEKGDYMAQKIKKIKKRATRIFTTITDVAALGMALIYIVFVGLLIAFDLGPLWLNLALLGITVLYLLFFVIKIVYINRVAPYSKISKKIKRAKKYIKYGMRLVNATFVMISIASLQTSVGAPHIIQIVGVITLVMTFVLALAWDLTVFFVRRKIFEAIAVWQSLPEDKRRNKIDMMIERFLDSLDGIDMDKFGDFFDAGFRAKTIVREKVIVAQGKREMEEEQQEQEREAKKIPGRQKLLQDKIVDYSGEQK